MFKTINEALGCGCLALIALGMLGAVLNAVVEFVHLNPIPSALIIFLIVFTIIMVISDSKPRTFEGLTDVPVKNYQNLPKLENPAGYVYVIRDRKYHKYKIGRTINPKSRLRDIQRNEVGQLEYIYLLRTKNAKSTERNLHERYAKFRIRKDREWFEFGESQLHDISNLVSPKPSQGSDLYIWTGVSVALLISLATIVGITSFFPNVPGSSGANKTSLPRVTHTPRSYVTRLTAARTNTATPTKIARSTRTSIPRPTNTASAIWTASSATVNIAATPIALYIRYFRDGSSGANVRSCPGVTDCSVIGGLKSGSIIRAPEITSGEEVQGSKVWIRFSFNDSPGFVHSSTVTEENEPPITIPAR